MLQLWKEYQERLRRTKKGRALSGTGRSVFVLLLLAISMVIVWPLTYSEDAHVAFNAATRRWSWLGDQLLGFDLTVPRQNIFSLARDLDRPITIVDHTTVHRSRFLGLTNWTARGTIRTVADALQWFHIPLTSRQARAVNLCQLLDVAREDQAVVIQPDPWQYGIASWYGPGFHGQLAASGEIYNMYEKTAAHKTLPLQSLVRVVAQHTGKSIVVRINDRGPYIAGRNIDLSYGSKIALGMEGLASVYLERIDPAGLDVSCQ